MINKMSDSIRVINSIRASVCGPNSRPLLPGENLTFLCSNYTGPGTNIREKVLNQVPPASQVDACSMNHDIHYYNITNSGITDPNLIAQQVRQSDQQFLSCVRAANTDNTVLQNLEKTLAYGLIRGKNILENAGLISPTRFLS